MDSFSPASVNAETAGVTVVVTGRGLNTMPAATVILQLGSSCTGSGTLVPLTVTAVGGAAGARTLTAQVPSVSSLTIAGLYSVCVQFSTGGPVKAGSTTLSVGTCSNVSCPWVVCSGRATHLT